MKKHILLLMVLPLFLALPNYAQGQSWCAELKLPKAEYLPGEPIVATFRLENKGPSGLFYYPFTGHYYLDADSKPCFVQQVTANFPPKSEAQEGPALPPQPVGTVHSQEVKLDWWCQLGPERPGFYGPHTVCYRAPKYKGQPSIETCVTFTIVRPLGEDAKAYEHFKGEPLKGPDLGKNFPHSTYAAISLWNEGLTEYKGMKTIGAEREFAFSDTQREAYKDSPSSLNSSRKLIMSVVDPWETLYRDFPSFSYRDQLLFGLSRCYFRLGEYQKAAPLLKELLAKFPDTESAQNGAAYRDVLKAHGMWPE